MQLPYEPSCPSDGLSFSWLVYRLVCLNFLKGWKSHFHAPTGTSFYFFLQCLKYYALFYLIIFFSCQNMWFDLIINFAATSKRTAVFKTLFEVHILYLFKFLSSLNPSWTPSCATKYLDKGWCPIIVARYKLILIKIHT